MNAFAKNSDNQEILNPEITPNNPTDLTFHCLAVMMKYGVDRVENAIKNTYFKNQASQLITAINAITSSI